MALRRSLNVLTRELDGQMKAVPRRHGSSIPGSGTSGLLWLLPIGFGGYYGYSSWTDTIKDPWEKHKAISEGIVDPPRTAFMGEILLYKVLPLRALSRLWGFVNEINLHPRLRGPLLGLYANAFGCNMKEAEEERLENYPNLGALFRRALKEGTRPVDKNAILVSPADGHVIWFGEVSPSGDLEQVKGVNYPIERFLGLQPAAHSFNSHNGADGKPSATSLMKNPEVNSLYHCLIYLAPGDYHRYHSPADWTVHERNHFPGELFSVSAGVTRWLKGLFNYNERVVYSGSWEHGFFCYAPVGATNVGSIKAYFDPSLETNLSRRRKKAITGGADYDGRKSFPAPISMTKGAPFGEFNLGSSIVLIFEAPKNFRFHLTPGQKIQCGNYLGRVEQIKKVATSSSATTTAIEVPEIVKVATSSINTTPTTIEVPKIVEVATVLEEANVSANAEVFVEEAISGGIEGVVQVDDAVAGEGIEAPVEAIEATFEMVEAISLEVNPISLPTNQREGNAEDSNRLESAMDIIESKMDLPAIAKEEVIDLKEDLAVAVEESVPTLVEIITAKQNLPVDVEDEEESVTVITPVEDKPSLA